jgi:hypothetical protein
MAMMTFDRLIKGENEIILYYNKAVSLWMDIRNSHAFVSADKLAEELSKQQPVFERECGGKNLGMEIMAMVGIGQFFSAETGFESTLNDALLVLNAFEKSYCSIEVKLSAEKAATIYHLTSRSLANCCL